MSKEVTLSSLGFLISIPDEKYFISSGLSMESCGVGSDSLTITTEG